MMKTETDNTFVSKAVLLTVIGRMTEALAGILARWMEKIVLGGRVIPTIARVNGYNMIDIVVNRPLMLTKDLRQIHIVV